MNILGICGSPREGNSKFALNTFLTECNEIGAKTELISLSEKSINFCLGCLSCEETQECVIDDDMIDISENIKKSDFIIFSFPSYFDNMPAIFKNFIDRTNPYLNDFKNKKCFIIISGQADEESRLNAYKTIENYCNIVEMEIIDKYLYMARDEDNFAKDSLAIEKFKQLAKKL